MQLTEDISVSQGNQKTIRDIERNGSFPLSVCKGIKIPKSLRFRVFEISRVNCRKIHITVKIQCRVIFAAAAYEYLREEQYQLVLD